MDDLTAFITARLDEDEAAAKAAHPGPWVLEEETGGFGPVAWISVPFGRGLPTAKSGLTRFAPLGTQDAGTIRHIARHDPARVLRDVAAKRAIVAETFEYEAKIDGEWGCAHSAAEIADGSCRYIDPDGIAVLRRLAAVWSGHPDYRAEWKP